MTDDLATLIERWPTVLVAASTQGIVTGWSRAGERLLGLAESQAVGRPLSALSSDPGEVERALDHLRRSQTVSSVCLTTRSDHNGHTALFVCLDAQRDRAGVIRELLPRCGTCGPWHSTPRPRARRAAWSYPIPTRSTA